jgi:hypothetical protein
MLINFVIFLCEYFTQGDVLRNNLLMRYFGKSFVNKRDTVELGILSPHPPVTHGPGGNLRACCNVLGQPQFTVSIVVLSSTYFPQKKHGAGSYIISSLTFWNHENECDMLIETTGCGKLTSFFIWHFILKKGS